MNDAQVVAFAHALGALFRKFDDRLKAAEQTLDQNGLEISVAAPVVNVEAPSVAVEGQAIDLSAVVDALNGLTADNLAEQVKIVAQGLVALAEKEGIDIAPLVEAEQAVGLSITEASERVSASHDRLIDAQAETNSALVRLADDLAKSQGAIQMQFTSVMEQVAAMQKDIAGQSGHIDLLHRAIVAPKKLTFGADGKPDGVRTELRQ